MNAWNTGNVDRIVEFYAENCEVAGPAPAPIRGKAELRKYLQSFFRAFSEVNGDAEVLVASGEYVAALIHVASVHSGPLDVGGKTIPATNKRLDDKLAVFLMLDADGKIAREWDLTNQLATFQQLGVPPPMAGATGNPTRR